MKRCISLLIRPSGTSTPMATAWRTRRLVAAGPYELSPPASAPQLASAALSIARDPDAFGIRRLVGSRWRCVRFSITFLDDDGEPLPLLVDDVVTGSINVTGNAGEDGLFRAEVALEASRIRDFVLDFDRIDAVRLRLYDSLGLSSAPVTVVPSPPPMVGAGDDCDTLEVLNQCGLNLRCLPGEEDGLGTCERSTPPRISSAEFFRGSTNGRDAYTVRVTGSDPEQDVVGLRIVLRDAAGVGPARSRSHSAPSLRLTHSGGCELCGGRNVFSSAGIPHWCGFH